MADSLYRDRDQGVAPNDGAWHFSDIERRIIRTIHKYIQADYRPDVSPEDIRQEARLYIAQGNERLRGLEYPLYVNEVKGALLRHFHFTRKHQPLMFDIDDPSFEAENMAWRRARTRRPTSGYLASPDVPAFAGLAYSPADVEAALTAMWHRENSLLGLPNPYAPDDEMPRAAGNPKASNTHYAVLIDIERAWRDAHLKAPVRRRLLMRFGLDWTQEDIAEHEGATQPSIRESLERGALRLANHLNGTDVPYEEGRPPTAADWYRAHDINPTGDQAA